MIRRYSNNRTLFLFLCFFLLLILLGGCQSKKETGFHSIQKHSKPLHKEPVPPTFFFSDVQAPIPIQAGQFNTINGWLNNETIIYMTNVNLGTYIYTYNIYTRENLLFFESEAPVSSVMASPSGDYVMIHSLPNSYEGIITILDMDGNELLNKRISAFEFNFEWNPYDEDKILITAFTEAWDYSLLLLSIKDRTLNEVKNKVPFVYWMKDDEILYLNWSENDLSLFAPLMKRKLGESNELVIMKNVYYVNVHKDLIMTVTVNPENSIEAEYTFFSNEFQKLGGFSAPHLTRYSDWLIPFFDFDRDSHLFTLQPLFSTDADSYDKGFRLVKFSLKDGKNTVVMENLRNEPLSCSPSGDKCLYGYFYEKLIDIETKNIIPFIEGF